MIETRDGDALRNICYSIYISWVLIMMHFLGTAILVMIGGYLATKLFKSDYRNDPVYKNNLRRLIERNRKFEKEK